MNALATGVDLVKIPRIERLLMRYGERFLTRVYTPDEIRFSRGRPAELAARFAAKEAVSKALGVGVRVLSPTGIAWHEVETLNRRTGQPYLVLSGRAQSLAEDLGLHTWSVSLSHDGGLAIAFVVALGADSEVWE